MRSPLIGVVLVAATAAAAVLIAAPGRAGEDAEARAQAALTSLGKTYLAAFEKGDAEALSRCFTEDAQYVSPGSEVVKGREAIRALAAAHFAAEPGARLTTERRRFRLVAEGVAAVEGVTTRHDAEGAVVSRAGYSILFVERAGGWLIADLKETPVAKTDDLTPREHLESLAWLVGDWMEEAEDARIRMTCRFAEDGPYLIQTFAARDVNGMTSTSTMRIGWDPLLGKIHSWFFDSAGGFGNAIWSQTAEGFVVQARAVSADGVVRTGVHFLTRTSEDVYRWDVRARIVGDTVADDQTYIIVRQPPEPR